LQAKELVLVHGSKHVFKFFQSRTLEPFRNPFGWESAVSRNVASNRMLWCKCHLPGNLRTSS
jgi:hypothetical protein